jgi:hypothetical protein
MIAAPGRHHDQSVDPTGNELQSEITLPLRIFIQTSSKHRHTTVAGEFLNAAMEHRLIGVGHILQEQAYSPRLSTIAPEVARRQILLVVQSSSGFDNSVYKLG